MPAKTKINHILDVLGSCNTKQQLNHAYKWAVFVAKKHNLFWLLEKSINILYTCKLKQLEVLHDIST